MKDLSNAKRVIFIQDFGLFKQGDTPPFGGICRGCGGAIIQGAENHVPVEVLDVFEAHDCNFTPKDWEQTHKTFINQMKTILAFGNVEGYINAQILHETLKNHIFQNGLEDLFISTKPEHNRCSK